jgi:endonuclease YncB( thermonuclease family)
VGDAWRPLLRVTRIVDGDTIRGFLDLGWCVGLTDPGRGGQGSFRLAGIDAPERGTPGGAEATFYLMDLLAVRDGATHAFTGFGTFPILSYEVRWEDNFGRTLCDLILPDGRLVTQAMLDAGHATPWKP